MKSNEIYPATVALCASASFASFRKIALNLAEQQERLAYKKIGAVSALVGLGLMVQQKPKEMSKSHFLGECAAFLSLNSVCTYLMEKAFSIKNPEIGKLVFVGSIFGWLLGIVHFQMNVTPK